MVAKIKKFVNEVVAEMKKVSWPTKEQLKESTKVVIGVTLVITLFILVVDQALTAIMKAIF
ncbi:MAG TPA: preprotein translocase subunit SecE [Candidatus Kapabacteria bacterium]|jgi:preprotein translocase subunit SecE|nr:preprotein translocase subunit SecE [Candidatus Kapabacteria bacterium]HPP40132.1 preprotein translocase subunit SecE [Candidatus Kapabacteria bacterium]HPU22639.1 preprotein translocase subunit SecE [Candidatus Kapabacteria bacterium]